MDYNDFIKNKQKVKIDSGIKIKNSDLSPALFDFQKDITRWAIESGCGAIFAMTGLGKTLMQSEFAKAITESENIRAIIVAPLAVSKQTARIAKKILNIDICDLRENKDIDKINIINYEQLHNIDLSLFNCVVLDESSILKNYSGVTRNEIIDKFRNYKYKLACTATPAPNDFMELGNHSEFIGVLSRSEMLSTFFIHDSGETQTWRLKGHAEDTFWQWVASWGSIITKPSDLGYDDGDFDLPPLNIEHTSIKTDKLLDGHLFTVEAKSLQERREAKRETINERVSKCAEIVNQSKDIYLVWCELNSESDMLKKCIKNSVEVKGSDSDDHKEKSMIDFADGKIKCLITKPSICGHGMNFQKCHNQIFVSLSDSFENYFQAVRRSWRFGQKKKVNIKIITSDLEGEIIKNIKRKEENAMKMIDGMVQHTRKYVMENLKHKDHKKIELYERHKIILPGFLEVNHGSI